MWWHATDHRSRERSRIDRRGIVDAQTGPQMLVLEIVGNLDGKVGQVLWV